MSENSRIADDALRGVKAIAHELGLSARQTYYQLEKGLIPAGKAGETWVASRTTLREHYQRITVGNAAKAIEAAG